MADAKPVEAPVSAPKPDAKPSKPVRPPNPVWRMMGLPNMSLKLPSRNWMIFLSITGSISAAVIYDKREKNRVQRKWCKLVEHLALEPLEPKAMPRKITVFMEVPPTDGLRIAQDHFKDYVKPVLVASGLDWDFIQGRKEGDVRAELAEKIRKLRLPLAEISEDENPTERIRRQNGTKEFDGPQGDIVIGRNTWKEYIRGLHEGWLGPLTAPAPPAAPVVEKLPEEASSSEMEPEKPLEPMPGITIHSVSSDSPKEDAAPETPEPAAEKPKKPPQPPPFISTSDYTSAPAASNLPSELDPSTPISFPHILGFMNTPTRMYRFFTRRRLADEIGRETAAIILSAARPYHTTPTAPSSSFAPSDENSSDITKDQSEVSEQATALIVEEKDWAKSIYKREEGERERTWIDDMVLDPRISSRMRRAELTPEDEERASKIIVTEEEIEGRIKGFARGLWRSGKEMTQKKEKHFTETLSEEESMD